MSGKRYYWLKLQDGFFSSKRIKKLRKLAGGDTFTIIYLKMQLLAIKTDGYLKWTGLEDDFAAELALDLDEDEDNVKVTLAYLQNCGLIETSDNVNFFLPYAVENTGSECASAKRWRDWKARQDALETNAEQTQRKQITNGEKEIEKEKEIELERELDKPPASRDSHVTVTGSHATDIDKEKEKEIETDFMDRPRTARFTPPTVEEVSSYCQERNNGIDAQRFVDYYESRGWMLGKTKMKDWRAAVRTWERGSDKSAITANTTEDVAKQIDYYGFKQEDLDATLKKLKGGS